MKAYICDQCQKREEPQKNYDLPPENWFGLRHWGTGREIHLCSIDCLDKHVNTLIGEQLKAVAIDVIHTAKSETPDVH